MKFVVFPVDVKQPLMITNDIQTYFAKAYSFSLDAIADPLINPFKYLYDEYRITKVVAKHMQLNNRLSNVPSNTRDWQQGLQYTWLDFTDDTTPVVEDNVQPYEAMAASGVKIRPVWKSWKLVLKPKVKDYLVTTTGDFLAKGKKGASWLPLTGGSTEEDSEQLHVPHYGYKWVLESPYYNAEDTYATQATFRVVHYYYVQFRGRLYKDITTS